ncbi:hypothetical protein [Shewanella sp. BC20]|nr:hypothetical protein [Shewanella sp. BC20]
MADKTGAIIRKSSLYLPVIIVIITGRAVICILINRIGQKESII